jgi:trypsin
MKTLSRVIAGLSTAILAASSVISFSGSAATTVRDANGDGVFDIADAVDTRYYTLGMYNPTNVKSYDFDGNGIISEADVQKIQCCRIGLIDENTLPGPSTEVTQAVSTTRTYLKHDCSSSDPASYTEYSLTVDSYNNTNNTNNINPYVIFPPNDMVPDTEMAVVKLKYNYGEATGFIVGDHVIATAAHCLYDYKTHKFKSNYSVRIYNESGRLVRVLPAKELHICKDFYYDTDIGIYNDNHDYGLIYVEEDLSEYGCFNLGVALDDYINNGGEVNVSGYPSEAPEGYNLGRFVSTGHIIKNKNSDNFGITYDADALPGNSGSPVYVNESIITNNGENRYNYKTVVAIHVSEYTNEPYTNNGVKITPDLLKFYCENLNINN